MRLLIYLSICLSLGLFYAPPSRAATEMEERIAIEKKTIPLFYAENFSELEKMANAFRTERSRTASGIWKLTVFHSAISRAIWLQATEKNSQEQYKAIHARIDRWAQQFPDSPAAHIARSTTFIEQAWSYRGGGYASAVKPEAWAPFHQHVTLAKDNLLKHKSVSSIDPAWYESMLDVAKLEGWPPARFHDLLNEALDREPLYYQTYFAALQYLLPKWNGGERQIEAFAQAAVKRTTKQEGQGMYARIYWYASQTEYKNDLFLKSSAAWFAMKEGFEDVIARYPDAWNLNNYAKFACLAQDKAKTRELLKRTSSSVEPKAWSPPSLREKCAEWAIQN